MSDDSQKRGPGDRNRINVNQEHELRYWTKELDLRTGRLPYPPTSGREHPRLCLRTSKSECALWDSGPRDGRDGSAKKELCNDVEAMHNLHFLATIKIEPGSNTAAYLPAKGSS